MRVAESELKLLSIHKASKSGDLSRVRELLEGACDINQGDDFGDTPLDIAAEAGKIDVVLYLLDHGARSPNFLLSACLCEDAEKRIELLKLIESRNLFEATHVRAAMGDKSFEEDEKLNPPDEFGFRAAFYAATVTYHAPRERAPLSNKKLGSVLIPIYLTNENRQIILSRFKKSINLFCIFHKNNKRFPFILETTQKYLQSNLKKTDTDFRNCTSIMEKWGLRSNSMLEKTKTFKYAIHLYEKIQAKSDDDLRGIIQCYSQLLFATEDSDQNYSPEELELWHKRDKVYQNIQVKTIEDIDKFCCYLNSLTRFYLDINKDIQTAEELNKKALKTLIEYKIVDCTGYFTWQLLCKITLIQVNQVEWPAARGILYQTLSLYMNNYEIAREAADCEEYNEIIEYHTIKEFRASSATKREINLLEIYECIISIFPIIQYADYTEYSLAWDIAKKWLNADEIPFDIELTRALLLLCSAVEKSFAPEDVKNYEEWGYAVPKEDEREQILEQVQQLRFRLSSLKYSCAESVIMLGQNLIEQNHKLKEDNKELSQRKREREEQPQDSEKEKKNKLDENPDALALINWGLDLMKQNQKLTEENRKLPQAKREREEQPQHPENEKKNKPDENPSSENPQFGSNPNTVWSEIKNSAEENPSDCTAFQIIHF